MISLSSFVENIIQEHSMKIRVKRGLNLNLKGKSKPVSEPFPSPSRYAVKPIDFVGIAPRLEVGEGDHVNAGDVLFYSKYQPQIKFTSPVSGKVKEIVRGRRRVILRVVIEADETISYKSFNPVADNADTILNTLLESGIFSFIKQRPYDIVPNPEEKPKAIYVRGYDSSPLAPDYDFALKGEEAMLQKGLDLISKLTDGKVYTIVKDGVQTLFHNLKNTELIEVSGPHPAANPSVAISRTHPIVQGERLWVVDPWTLVFIGRLFENGQLDLTKKVAFAGGIFKEPKYYKLIAGAYLKDGLSPLLKQTQDIRIISGGPLTGTNITEDGFIGLEDNVVTVLKEGKEARLFGWLPFIGTSRKTVYRLNFDWFSNKEMDLDTSLHGEERAFVMTEEMEEVFPFDIFPAHLLKAVLTEDVDNMERLGILEVVPEDFALIDYISSSKIEAQHIIRKGLNQMMVEIG